MNYFQTFILLHGLLHFQTPYPVSQNPVQSEHGTQLKLVRSEVL